MSQPREKILKLAKHKLLVQGLNWDVQALAPTADTKTQAAICFSLDLTATTLYDEVERLWRFDLPIAIIEITLGCLNVETDLRHMMTAYPCLALTMVIFVTRCCHRYFFRTTN